MEIEFSNQQQAHPVDADRLVRAARMILDDAGARQGSVSIAVVDDATIHKLNRRHLQHDYATDTLSFLFDWQDEWLEGEVIVSADTAAREACEYGWQAEDELLLYVIHAVLHLVGYDDVQEEPRRLMRQRERQYLARFGLHGGSRNASHPERAEQDGGRRAFASDTETRQLDNAARNDEGDDVA